MAPEDAVLFASNGLHEMRKAQDEDLAGASWKHGRCRSADDCLGF
jgi:hypothetical protein